MGSLLREADVPRIESCKGHEAKSLEDSNLLVQLRLLLMLIDTKSGIENQPLALGCALGRIRDQGDKCIKWYLEKEY
jgi:hypothetical protein